MQVLVLSHGNISRPVGFGASPAQQQQREKGTDQLLLPQHTHTHIDTHAPTHTGRHRHIQEEQTYRHIQEERCAVIVHTHTQKHNNPHTRKRHERIHTQTFPLEHLSTHFHPPTDLSCRPTGVTERVVMSPSVLVSRLRSKTGVWGSASRSIRSSWASVHSDRVKEGWRLTD